MWSKRWRKMSLGGCDAVVWLCVIDLALRDVHEDADYEAAVVGFLANDVGEGCGSGFGLRRW